MIRYPEHTDYNAFRDSLLDGYQPTNPQERLQVHEIAFAWRRLEECRHRERLFFDLQRNYHCKIDGAEPGSYDKQGAEVVMWMKDAPRAYDQILRAIREAELAFDRALRRLEINQDRRLRREAQQARIQTHAKTASPVAARAASAGHSFLKSAPAPAGPIRDSAAPSKPNRRPVPIRREPPHSRAA